MADADLVAVLTEGRARGLLGPGPVEVHVEHARAYCRAVDRAPARVVDLGSGGGVPGLIVARCWPEAEVALVEASSRRVAFLVTALDRLGLPPRVSVRHGRAEEVGRDPAWRGAFDLVTARSFGPPAVVAECAAPLLRPGGRAVVSEPPDSDGSRWRADALDNLGMGPARLTGDVPCLAVLEQRRPCPDRYPRRPGVPARRPLF